MLWSFHDIGAPPSNRRYRLVSLSKAPNFNQPSDLFHPVLVRERHLNIEERQTALTVSYGTSNLKEETRGDRDLIIPADEINHHKLRCPTRFDLDDANRLILPWCLEFFTPPGSQPGIIISHLGPAAKRRLTNRLRWRLEQKVP